MSHAGNTDGEADNDQITSRSEGDLSIEATLSASEKSVLKAFEGKVDSILTPEEIQTAQKFGSQVEVMNALSWLRSKKFVDLREIVKEHYSLDKEGKEFLEKGTPERIVITAMAERAGKEDTAEDANSGEGSKGTGEMRIGELGPLLGKNVSVAIGWLRKKQWATIRKEEGETILTPTKMGLLALGMDDPDIALLSRLTDTQEKGLSEEDITDAELPVLDALRTRKGVVKVRELVTRQVTLTPQGRDIVSRGIEIRPEVSALTPELLQSGKWREVEIRPYDVQAFAPKVRRGTLHPLTILLDEIREIFVSMGFQEIQGEYVESCFWNMDVLFIPQDHPARELQDTFYLKNPETISLQSDEESGIIERIKAVHENGGETGSTGWGYEWSKDEAERALLRTHTTVNTIRHLSIHSEPPVKVFSLGRVFRKEAIDSTHLPEFHQIEGICMEEGANFGMLIALLREFYSRMGFKEIRFRPSYYPYTEPSMDVEVRFKGKWLELGGSGIFRQEVTQPFGIKYPVLAWGLGLERLAMLKLGLNDIRDLYISDIDWLQEVEGKL